MILRKIFSECSFHIEKYFDFLDNFSFKFVKNTNNEIVCFVVHALIALTHIVPILIYYPVKNKILKKGLLIEIYDDNFSSKKMGIVCKTYENAKDVLKDLFKGKNGIVVLIGDKKIVHSIEELKFRIPRKL